MMWISFGHMPLHVYHWSSSLKQQDTGLNKIIAKYICVVLIIFKHNILQIKKNARTSIESGNNLTNIPKHMSRQPLNCLKLETIVSNVTSKFVLFYIFYFYICFNESLSLRITVLIST